VSRYVSIKERSPGVIVWGKVHNVHTPNYLQNGCLQITKLYFMYKETKKLSEGERIFIDSRPEEEKIMKKEAETEKMKYRKIFWFIGKLAV
jgi:hypothetical protein